MNTGNVLSVAWTIAAWYFIASVICAPVFLAVRKARARGKRLFADEPTERVRQLRPHVGDDHYWDS